MSELSNLSFRMVLDEVSDPILIANPEGKVIYANKAFAKLTEFDMKEILGSKAGTLWGKMMPAEFYEELWNTIKHKKTKYKGILKNKKKSGTLYDAELRINPIVNQFNEVIYFIGVEKDISHQVQEDRFRNEFMSIISHQMRSPLTAIKWNLELIETRESKNISPNVQEIVKDISDANDKLISIVDRFLTLTHIESGKISISPHKIRIREFLTTALKEERINATHKKIKTNVDIKEGIDVIYVDSKMVGEALSNLYSNAIKYTPEGGTISINVNKNEKGISFSVTDSGFGIPEEDKNQIFNKFFRASNIKKYSIEGTGVGLYVAKMIIDSCGGQIDFESKINKGTTFRFTIPQPDMSTLIDNPN